MSPDEPVRYHPDGEPDLGYTDDDLLTQAEDARRGQAEDWMEVRIVAPPEVGAAVMDFLRERFGYVEPDWCVLERREDYSRVDYAPAPARSVADYEYTVDWRSAS
jgi:hypothetical protein